MAENDRSSRYWKAGVVTVCPNEVLWHADIDLEEGGFSYKAKIRVWGSSESVVPNIRCRESRDNAMRWQHDLLTVLNQNPEALEEAVNDAELLRNELTEEQRQNEELRTEVKNLRESAVRQSQKAVRLELGKDTTSLERHNRELRWQLTKALGKLPAKDIHEVLGSTEE